MCTDDVPTVVVTGANGRLGNNLIQIIRAIYMATALNATCVKFSALMQTQQHVGSITNFPDTLSIESNALIADAKCKKVALSYQTRSGYGGNFWTKGCHGTTAYTAHRIAQKYIAPHFKPQFWQCAKSHALDDKLLTIHLRGGDLLPGQHSNVDKWFWDQPPCWAYHNVIRSGGFEDVLIITEPELHRGQIRHPCISWLRTYGVSSGVSVRVQSTSLIEDACAIYRAKNLVLACSTFSESLAVLSGKAKRIYFYNAFRQNSVMNCILWPNANLYAFIGESVADLYQNNVTALIDYMETYQRFDGPHLVSTRACAQNIDGDWVVNRDTLLEDVV